MAADTQRKAYRYTCNMVRPQIYSEKSLMESVVDFFSDVVPQAYTGTQKNEDKEKIQWVRFENCDCNDVSKNPDMFRSDTKGLPLLLILGYSNGVQIWNITPNGEAQEILSMRQGPVRICRILPNPDPVLGHLDSFSSKRPLIVLCDSSSAGQPYCGLKFVSLKTGDEVHSISFKTLPVQNIECNKRFLVIVFLEKICVHESCQFQQLFWITSCFPCSGPNVNPIALSARWLAYADKRLVAMHQSCGGMSGDGSQSYAATVLSAAKGAFKGLSMFGEAMVSSVTGSKPVPHKRDYVQLDNGNRPGIVTVVDIQNIHNDHFNVNEDNEGDGLIAHFHAHANEPVSNLAFDNTGTLLVTACKLGHNFHVFRLMAHPVSSSLGAVHHLYTLHRGETTAKVIDISFNHDSRWITVSSHRGTTHLFPITPYGGSVNVRTHCKPHVVNRASRFHRSAGIDEFDHTLGRRSPVLSTSPSSSGQYDRYPTLIQQNTLNNNMGNPRLPPYPHPITIYPAFQVKQPLNVVLNPGNKNQSPSHSPTGFDNVYCVCAKFCTPRLCVVGSPKLDMERREAGKRPVDSLFVMAQSGTLVEYVLEPRAKTVTDKVTDDCLLELNVVGRMQWNLQRLKNSQELRPPLPSNSPLILAHEAVVSQIPTAPDLYDLPGLTRQDSKDSLSSDHSGKDDTDEQWLSQVEIITHAGPHRRLWMGPQFSFKTYQENTTVLSSTSSSLLSQSPESNMAAMDLMGDEGDLESLKLQPTRSNPVSMPNARPAYRRLSGSDSSPVPGQGVGAQSVPMVIEAGSFDQSPHLLDVYSNWTESSVAKQPRGSDDLEEDRLKETLADAMVESPCKDIEKLSLRHQDIPRTSVKTESGRSQTGRRSTSGYSNRADVGSSVKRSSAVDSERKVVERKSVAANEQKKADRKSESSGRKNSHEGISIKSSDKCVDKVKIESSVADKTPKSYVEVDENETNIDTNKNGKKKGKAKKSLDSELKNVSKAVTVEKCDSKADNAEKVEARSLVESSKISSSKTSKNDVSSDEKMSISEKKNYSNKNGSNSGRGASSTECVSSNESTSVPGKATSSDDLKHEINDINGNKSPESSLFPKTDVVDVFEGTKSKSCKKGILKKNDCKEEEIVNIVVDKKEKSAPICNDKANDSDEKVSPQKSKSKKKNKKQGRCEMSESIMIKEEETASVSKEGNEINKELLYGVDEYKSIEKKKSVQFEVVCNKSKMQELEESKEESPENSVSNETVKVASHESEAIFVNETTCDTSVYTTDELQQSTKHDGIEKGMEEDVQNGFVSAKSKKKKKKDSKRIEEKFDIEVDLHVENQNELKSENCDSILKDDISSVSHLRDNKSTLISFDNNLEVDDTNLTALDKDKVLTEDISEHTVENKDHDEPKTVSEEMIPEKKELDEEIPSVVSSNSNNGTKTENASDISESKKITPIENTEMTEVKSKKKRKKKKNGMEESIHFEKSESLTKSFSFREEDARDEIIESLPPVGSSVAATVIDDNDDIAKYLLEPTKLLQDDTVEKKVEISSETEIKKEEENGEVKAIKEENCTIIAKNGSAVKTSRSAKINSREGEDQNEKKTVSAEKEVQDSKSSTSSKDSDSLFTEETVVVHKKKNKKKKKNVESKTSPEKSPEPEVIDMKIESESIETPYDKYDSDKLVDDQKVNLINDEVNTDVAYKCVDVEKEKKSEDAHVSNDAMHTQLKSVYVDVIEDLSDVKKMDDSAESGSKYETAESAEDDPSAWERSEFEECMEENIVEEVAGDTKVGNVEENIIEEEMIEEFAKDDSGKNTLPDQAEENGQLAEKQVDQNVDIDCINPSGSKSESNSSVMTKSMYEDSAGSSSRSSEEREDVRSVKNGNTSKTEGKNKKKKRKNRK